MSGKELANRLTRLTTLGNLTGALLSFAYFTFLDASARASSPSLVEVYSLG